jgi:putative spermidine/putrescine transport system permease protein
MKEIAVANQSEGTIRRSFSISPRSSPLFPFFIFVGFFLIWPIICLIIRSFKGNENEWTFANYSPLLHGSYFHAFVVSIKLASITALIGAILGSFFVYAIVNNAGPRVTSVLDSVCAVFANSGGVPLAFMFIAAFGTEGLFTKFLKSIGWDIYAGKFTLFSFTGVVLVYSFFQIPLMILVFKPALQGLRKEWSEASINLGANSITYWRHVVIPILTPSFLSAFFLLFAGGFSAYATARAMTVGTVPLVPIIIGTLVDGNVISNQTNLGDALAVGMIVVAGVAMSGYLIAQRRANRWRAA